MSAEEDPPDLEEKFARELAHVLEPLVTAVEEGSEGFDELLVEAGLEAFLAPEEHQKLRRIVEDAVDPVADVIAAVEAGDLDDIDDVIDAIDGVYGAFTEIDDLTFRDLDDAGERFLDFLLVRYLDQYHHALHSSFSLFDVVGETEERLSTIDLSRIADVLRDPLDLPKETFGWADDVDNFAVFLLLYYLKELFWAIGLPASLDGPEETEILTLTDVDSLDDLEDTPSGFEYELRVPVISFVDNEGTAVAGFKLLPLPGKSPHLPGLAMVLFGSFAAEFSEELADDWSFNVDSTGTLGNRGFAIRPRTEGTVDVTHVNDVTADAGTGSGSAADVLKANATLTHEVTEGEEDDERVLLGTAGASRVALTSLSAQAVLRYDSSKEEFLLKVELPATGTLGVHPSDFDGFLASVFPQDGIVYDFEVTVGWSSTDGFYFEDGATLNVTLPAYEKLGSIDLKEIFLSLAPNIKTGEITVQAAASAAVEFGPITGTVTQLGLETDISFPENRDGNMGIVNLEIGLKPPEGVGLDVSAGPVTGGGYLDFDPENERYVGTGQLTFPNGLSISVVGLITTELPDGSDGFSMMLVVAGEFSAVQLGFGFRLNGVGGLLGINRSFRKQSLHDIVRQGTLQNVLFPEDVVDNAQRIISDVRSIFPPTRGTHVFGPMLKIGWGTPSIISATMGVVLEIPSFRIAILGKIEMALPDLEAERPEGLPEEAPFPPIQVNLDVVGIIDVPGKSLSLDASLYDSRIAQWKMSGDMALRSSWSKQSRFLLSIGGYNPRYTKPENFPKLDRIKVSLDVPGGQPVVDFTGYLAVSSNTFQVGARVHAEIEAGIVYVHGGFGFDALFRFNPFSFIFDFYANLGVDVKGLELAIGINGTISGPTPFNIRGKVKVSVGLFDVSANINVTLGKDAKTKQLPTAEVLPELVDALNEPNNWEAQLPGDGNSVVTLRSAKSDEARARAKESAGFGGVDSLEPHQPVLAHPLGTLTVRQTVVPLSYAIEKFGEARPTSYDKFRIADVSVGNVVDRDRQSVDDEFAPAAYRKLDDAEKLDMPDFVDLNAGTTVGDLGLVVGGEATPGDVTEAAFTYEEKFYDEQSDHYGSDLSSIDPLEAGSTHTAFTVHELSKGKRGVQPESDGLFGVDDDDTDSGLFGPANGDYVVVMVDTLTPVSETVPVHDDDADGDNDRSDGETNDGSIMSGYATFPDTVETQNERVRPALYTGTSKGRAQAELKRFASERNVDERRLQVVPVHRLEESDR